MLWLCINSDYSRRFSCSLIVYSRRLQFPWLPSFSPAGGWSPRGDQWMVSMITWFGWGAFSWPHFLAAFCIENCAVKSRISQWQWFLNIWPVFTYRRKTWLGIDHKSGGCKVSFPPSHLWFLCAKVVTVSNSTNGQCLSIFFKRLRDSVWTNNDSLLVATPGSCGFLRYTATPAELIPELIFLPLHFGNLT